jgi:hypothetical protein
MKLNISSNDLRDIAKSCDYEGSGNRTSPYKFQNYKNIPENLSIDDSNLCIIFHDCHFNNLTLDHCQNMSFKNCYFLNLKIRDCNNLDIFKCEIEGIFYLKKSINISISKTEIGKLRLSRSHNCVIKSSTIYIIDVNFSLGNSFENTYIEDFNPAQLVNGGQKWEILKIRTLIYCFLIIIFLFILQYEPWRYEPLYFILGSILIIIPAGRLGLALYSNYILNKLREKFGLNVLISLQ